VGVLSWLWMQVKVPEVGEWWLVSDGDGNDEQR
jgi:hypothetical protein